MKKIKVVPIKSESLCNKCKYSAKGMHCITIRCTKCEMINLGNGIHICKCNRVAYGSKCKYFKLPESEAEK